jgi:hypothetical protein
MDPIKKTAVIVGALFITATVAYSLSALLLDPILGGPDYLTKASANDDRVMIGALLVLLDAVAVAGIAVVIYPILRKHSEALALGYVGARIAEGILFGANAITILTLLTLSQEYAAAGASAASHFQTVGALLLAAGDWAFLLGFGLAFALSALILNALLYRSQLIPRWLSGWGLVGVASIFAYYVLRPFSSNLVEMLFLPIAVQEMVFAVWLIAKGFNPSAIASKSAKTDCPC